MAKRRNRWIMILLVIVLAFGMASSSALAFGVGDRGPDVFAVQGMLKSIGYYYGAIDGIYGNVTASSVRAYQRAAGLPVSGDVDANTLRSILATYSRAKVGAGAGTGTGAGADGTTGGAAGGTAGGGTAGGGTAADGTTAGGYSLSQSEQQMVALVNQARAAAGLPALSTHVDLSRVARYKSGDMVKNNYFSHDSPTYGSPFQMMTNFGVQYSSAGENIACNQTVARAHEALMNSPGHRANIMSTDFTHIGIGISAGGKCGEMYTQMFLKP